MHLHEQCWLDMGNVTAISDINKIDEDSASSQKPICSVVIAAHNAENYITEAIQSLQLQTLQDIEIIVVDDFSTDSTVEAVLNIMKMDARVSLIKLARNKGQSSALNTGILAAKGQYIAFMDADDLALPLRLEVQISAMENDTQLILVGGSVITMCGVTSADGLIWHYETDSARIKISSLFKSEFMTGSMCFRLKAILKHHLFFDPNITVGADWELSIRAMQFGNVINLQETLLRYRIHGCQLTTDMSDNIMSSSAAIRRSQLELLGISPSDEEMMLHLAVSPCNYWAFGSHSYYLNFEKKLPALTTKWFSRLLNANQKTGRYDEVAFSHYLKNLYQQVIKTKFNKLHNKSYCPVIIENACPAERRCR